MVHFENTLRWFFKTLLNATQQANERMVHRTRGRLGKSTYLVLRPIRSLYLTSALLPNNNTTTNTNTNSSTNINTCLPTSNTR